MWEYRSTDELYHHGVLGQRWGVRRYQNADGTLTDAGKKKAAKLRDKYEKVTGQSITGKNKQANHEVPGKKKIKEMSNKELASYTKRLTLESNFISAYNRREKISNPQVKKEKSKLKSFVQTVSRNVVIPALTDASKSALQNKVYKILNDSGTNKRYKTYNTKTTVKNQNTKKVTKPNSNKTKKK